MSSDPEGEVERLCRDAELVQSEMRRVAHSLAQARASYYRGGNEPRTRLAMEQLEEEATKLGERLATIESRLMEVTGIPQEVIDAAEAQRDSHDDLPKYLRTSLRSEITPPTGSMDDLLPEVLPAVTSQETLEASKGPVSDIRLSLWTQRLATRK